MSDRPLLSTTGLTRAFGGLVAVKDVSIECHVGRVHAVIGPNGAGKSTLINMLSGDLAPSGGRVMMAGEDVTGARPHRMSKLGVGRSYQKTNVFLPFTAIENCRIAAQSRLASSMRFVRPALSNRAVNEAAERALAAAGLEGREGLPVTALSHGEQRQVEIAMVLATSPRVLLLDEPLAGMGAEESLRIVALLRRLVPDHAILLVEHDMDAVFAVAHRLTVMVNGAVLESGPPEAIRASPAVREAYLGTEDVIHE
jgi:branched-chain amino acid transport system ATP-binding protein